MFSSSTACPYTMADLALWYVHSRKDGLLALTSFHVTSTAAAKFFSLQRPSPSANMGLERNCCTSARSVEDLHGSTYCLPAGLAPAKVGWQHMRIHCWHITWLLGFLLLLLRCIRLGLLGLLLGCHAGKEESASTFGRSHWLHICLLEHRFLLSCQDAIGQNQVSSLVMYSQRKIKHAAIWIKVPVLS